jgi:hypothetical protein
LQVRHRGDRPSRRRWLAIVTPIALLAAGALFAGGELASTPAAAAPAAAAASVPSNFAYACGDGFKPGRASCLAIENTTAHPTALTVRPGAIPSGFGYGPSDLQSAYGLTSASASDGAGTTVAVVDAYNDPTAASDLATYRADAGLPALTAGQLTVYNQEGETASSSLPGPSPSGDDWSVEVSLDLDMVSAICPLCKIDLVEADNDIIVENGVFEGNLFKAEQTAATTLGAKYISDSWAAPESAVEQVEPESTLDSTYFGVPGVVYVAAASDFGYDNGIAYPAVSPNVVAVGGTSLTPASNSRGWTESVWDTNDNEATGSGCSAYEPQPSWQASIPILTAACPNRADNDVAADADPNTGVAIYDTSNQTPSSNDWYEYGGNSESSPIIAAVFALAGNNGNGGNNAAESIYDHTSDLYEVTGGSDGECTPPAVDSVLCTATGAADTWNGPTGWGTPDGITAFESNSAAANTVTVSNPGTQTGTVGTAISGLQISATDSASGQTLTYSASNLPPGLSISSSGLITGTPTTAGTSQVTVKATDSTGASGSQTFTWTISSASTANTVTVTSPGNQTGTVGTPISSLQISATDSASGQTLTYTASGLPAGLSISSSGLISGTPTTTGTNTVEVTATDTTGASGSQTFTWTISPSAADTVTVTNPGNQTGTVGTAASVQISATDSDSSQTLTYTATGLPAGLSISSTGLISGTPTTAGTNSVTVTATDTSGASGSTSFTWTISAASSTSGNKITVTNPGAQASIAGTAITNLQISATDSDSSQTLTYTATGLPPGLSISSSGLISGTPSVPGLGRVLVTATDTTGASGTAFFIWAVGPPAGSGGSVTNTITVISPGNQTGTVGTAASLQISATDSDSSQPLEYIASDLPPGLSVNSSTGLISGTPAIAGTSNVGIIVGDPTGAAVSTNFTWTIKAASAPAVAGCTARQLLGNPGFDSGSIKPWSATAGVLAKSQKGLRAQAGNWLAKLDGYGAAHKDTLAQTVTIPAACKSAVLTFWVEVHSSVTNKTQQAKNTLVLDILNASGKVVKTVAVATAADHGTTYVKHTVSLASYSGKTITIKFTGTEVSGGSTTFLEDSNALNVS